MMKKVWIIHNIIIWSYAAVRIFGIFLKIPSIVNIVLTILFLVYVIASGILITKRLKKNQSDDGSLSE